MFSALLHSFAAVSIDDDAFGRSLGGWSKKDKSTAEYPLSGAVYRTYKPEISPTPDGGIFLSVRIDHVRGWLSTDDHAVLELTINPKGGVVSAQSSIAIQGKSIKSEMILGGNEGGKAILSPEGAVQNRHRSRRGPLGEIAPRKHRRSRAGLLSRRAASQLQPAFPSDPGGRRPGPGDRSRAARHRRPDATFRTSETARACKIYGTIGKTRRHSTHRHSGSGRRSA